MHTSCLTMQYDFRNLEVASPGVRILKVGDNSTVYYQVKPNVVSIILKHVAKAVLGCELEDDGDHIRFNLIVNGRVIANFKYSHSWRGNFQIPEVILHSQAR